LVEEKHYENIKQKDQPNNDRFLINKIYFRDVLLHFVFQDSNIMFS